MINSEPLWRLSHLLGTCSEEKISYTAIINYDKITQKCQESLFTQDLRVVLQI